MKLSDGEKMIWAASYARARTQLDREQSIIIACLEIEALREDSFDLTPTTLKMFHGMVPPRGVRMKQLTDEEIAEMLDYDAFDECP